MGWEVEYTDEFFGWFDILTEAEQDSVAASVGLLESLGPELSFPYSSRITSSRHAHELPSCPT